MINKNKLASIVLSGTIMATTITSAVFAAPGDVYYRENKDIFAKADEWAIDDKKADEIALNEEKYYYEGNDQKLYDLAKVNDAFSKVIDEETPVDETMDELLSKLDAEKEDDKLEEDGEVVVKSVSAIKDNEAKAILVTGKVNVPAEVKATVKAELFKAGEDGKYPETGTDSKEITLEEDGTFEIRMLEVDAYKEGTYKVVVTATPEKGEAVTKESEEVKVVKEEVEAVDKTVNAINEAAKKGAIALGKALEEAGIEYDTDALPNYVEDMQKAKTIEGIKEIIENADKADEAAEILKELKAVKDNPVKFLGKLNEYEFARVADDDAHVVEYVKEIETLDSASSKKDIQKVIDQVNIDYSDKLDLNNKSADKDLNAAKATIDALLDSEELKSETGSKTKKDLQEDLAKLVKEKAEALEKTNKAVEKAKELMTKYEEAKGAETEDNKYDDVYTTVKTAVEAVEKAIKEDKAEVYVDKITEENLTALEEKTKKLAEVGSVDAEIVTKIEEVDGEKTVKAGTVLEVELTARKATDASADAVESPAPKAEVQDKYNETIARIDVKHGDNTIVLRNVVFEKGIAKVEVKLEKVAKSAALDFGKIAGVATEVKTEAIAVEAGDLTVMEAKAEDLTKVTITGQDDYKNEIELNGEVVDATIDGKDILLENITTSKNLTISKLELEAEKEYTIKLDYEVDGETKTFEITFKTPKAEKEEKPEA